MASTYDDRCGGENLDNRLVDKNNNRVKGLLTFNNWRMLRVVSIL